MELKSCWVFHYLYHCHCRLTSEETLAENSVVYGGVCNRRLAKEKPAAQTLQIDFLSKVSFWLSEWERKYSLLNCRFFPITTTWRRPPRSQLPQPQLLPDREILATARRRTDTPCFTLCKQYRHPLLFCVKFGMKSHVSSHQIS